MTKADAEQETREQLAQAGRSLARIGVYSLAGHISLRIPDSELIAITPGGGLDKSRMTAADITIIDPTGKRVSGTYPPPLETPIHTIIHAARPELGSIAHLHAHWSTVFSVLQQPMEIVLLPATTLGRRVPTFDIPQLITDDNLGQALCDALGGDAAVLMRWHGITVVGNTLAEMFERALFIEENARLQWEATALGPPLPVPDEAYEGMRANRDPKISGLRTFNYYANLERSASEQVHEARSGFLVL